jgi:hypothetical protein
MVEAGGVGLQHRIEPIELIENVKRSILTPRHNRGFYVHSLYTDIHRFFFVYGTLDRPVDLLAYCRAGIQLVGWSTFKTHSPDLPRRAFGHNPVWVVWKADSAVGKTKLAFLPLVFRGTREAAVRTAPEHLYVRA